MTAQDLTETRSPGQGLFLRRDRSTWVRLRTLIVLRWVAIVGQIAALTVAQQIYGLQLPVGLCYLAVGVSVIGNLIAIFVFPENTRLNEVQNFMMVLFDLLQLGFLLFLTGGLHNPFSLLLLGPVTISASVLTLRSFVIMGSVAALIASLLARFYIPLLDEENQLLEIPDIFLFGHWLAIVIAIVFFGGYSRRVSQEMHSMSDALTATQMALAREQKLTDLGGVVAAAAHELGTPLATIKLTSAELIEELENKPDLKEDAELIREQADRCRDILRDMGRAGKDDVHLRQAPLSATIEEAAQPHEGRGILIGYSYDPFPGGATSQPSILRMPEIIHGLRNLVQNAVDFAHDHVWIEAEWDDNKISIRIADDGPGFPTQMIGRIGDPFMRRARKSSAASSAQRAEYEGMGLGLFIAKTLLERTGGELTFANGRDTMQTPQDDTGYGAIVEVTWARNLIDGQTGVNAIKLGENTKIRS
ncbi:MAG: ActS/PrrB/RegB family redox-sensitive histidine kinase [Pseudomonadota bacterium]